MERAHYHLTERSKRILQLAAKYNQDVIEPHHLFIAACREAAGVCGELHVYLHKQLGNQFLNFMKEQDEKDKGRASQSNLSLVLEKADEKRQYYRQTLINEGHIIQSILETDSSLNDWLTEEMKEAIIDIACVPRDMVVHLGKYQSKSHIGYKNSIRRAVHADLPELKQFIKSEFGDRWIKRINHLPASGQLSVFLAEYNGEIIGFACFDVEKKGMFGPMGTSNHIRLHSVGKELLHRSLMDMADRGYAYAVIEQAGPIEFYEKACGAKLIPWF
ncbi:GNAT family N-acetyltransferase [Pradoshia sp.]|uniref:GNAT family N-acetyltransferase n=1 Tax=Pradoshia sp. TaxID=2651281 RepID=UPI003F0C1D26